MSLPNIKHPITKLVVPSTNQTVVFRPMLVKEEKILLMAKQSGEPHEVLSSIKQVVGNCATDKSFSVDKIAIFDLEYLFLQLRAISIDNIVKLSYKDVEDNKEYDFDVDIQKVKVVFPDDLQKVLPLGENISVTMKWPSAGLYDDAAILDMTPEQIQDEIVLRHIDKIVFMEGSKEKTMSPDPDNRTEIIDFINNLSIAAYKQMQKFIENTPKMEYKIEYTNAMGTERKMVLSSLTDFFTLL